MISIYKLKPKFRELLRPICDFLHKKGITPNQITIFTAILSLIGGLSLIFCKIGLLLVPFFLFIRMALNAIDGLMATEYKMCSKEGELFNEMGDVFADICLYLPLMIFFQDDFYILLLISLFVLIGVLTEFSGLISKILINIRAYQGPMGKSDRAFLIGLYSLFLFFFPEATKTYSIWVYMVACLIGLITCFNRLKPIFRN